MLPNPLIVLLRGQETLTIEGAVSETAVDETTYDATTYRDLLPANYVGRAWSSTPTFPATTGTAPEGADDQLNHVAPRLMAKKRTMMKWWDGAAGTGNVVGKCWADQFVGYGRSAQFIQ